VAQDSVILELRERWLSN